MGVSGDRLCEDVELLRGQLSDDYVLQRGHAAVVPARVVARLPSSKPLTGGDPEDGGTFVHTSVFGQDAVREGQSLLALARLEMVELVHREHQPRDVRSHRAEELELRFRDRGIDGREEQGRIALGQEVEGGFRVV